MLAKGSTRALILWLALQVSASALAAQTDWPQFNFDSRHSGVNPLETQITRGNVGSLRALYSVDLPGEVDGPPVFLSLVTTPGGTRDLLFATTKDGRLLALDAGSGALVWSRQPASGPRYTTSSPAIDPNRQFVYSYGLDGKVHKYRVGDGTEITGGGWPELATRKPEVEKGSPALDVATTANGTSYLYVANGGYPGDQGDYQGHVTAIELATGAQRVWNANCSDRPLHFVAGGAPDCPSVQTAIWSRAAVVYDADNGKIFMATGNGPFDGNKGGHDWGDSVFALHPDGSGSGGIPLDSYTPPEFQSLADSDADLGSTAPALLPAQPASSVPHLAVQGGKDGMLRLLNLDDLSGQGGPGHLGGEIQKIPVPQGGEVLTAPAVWVNPADATTWVFVANEAGISGLRLSSGGSGAPALLPRWTDGHGGTSPVLAGGVLFYDGSAGMRGLNPLDGSELWIDGTPAGFHWQSPIVVNGHVYVADSRGTLVAYGLPAAMPCIANEATLCLNNGRFQVRATWKTGDGATGSGRAVPLTSDTGSFWFFNRANYEVLVKVLNGCPLGGSYWVFAAGLTDVRTLLTVVDTQTGAQRVYRNPQGRPFEPIQDTAAFPTCP